MITLTVCAPAAGRRHATDLALYLGTSNGGTPEEWVGAFNPTRQDAQGKIWHVLSMPVSEGFIAAHMDALVQVPGLLIWTPGEDAPPVPTTLDNPGAIIAVVGVSGSQAVAAVGLAPVGDEGEEASKQSLM